jgi:flavin-dependent dehydrogenase
MPVRATKRGEERTPLGGSYDVLICGASFAGLAVARELQGSGRRVLMVDRYEVGERQTSACAAPTAWLEALGVQDAILQTFGDLVVHRPRRTYRWKLPFTFSTFDYRRLCGLLREQGSDTAFETAKVHGRTGQTVHTDRGDLSAPLIVDAMGWRRVLAGGAPIQPPEATLSRGLEVHPPATGRDLELWLDAAYVPAGYGWAFPAADEVRIGWGSFDPRKQVKDETVQLTRELGLEPNEYQGNWIPHELRRATEDGIFFAGDSAGHCLPTTAEGIRTALYFGLVLGRELRAVLDGRQTREQALAAYAGFSDSHEWKFRWMLRTQRAVGRINGTPLMDALLSAMTPRYIRWSFGHYFRIAPPDVVRPAGARAQTPAPVAA